MYLVATHIPSGESLRFFVGAEPQTLGRSTSSDPPDKLAIPFDPKLSRRTAIVWQKAGALWVERDQSRYPLFHEGQEKESFQLFVGQRFSCAETVFEIADQTAQTMTVQAMEQSNRENPLQILEIVLGLQPLLAAWHSLEELCEKLSVLLRELMPNSQVGLFRTDPTFSPTAVTSTLLKPSRSLIKESLTQALPVYHKWGSAPTAAQPTQTADESWALAVPLVGSQESLVLYAVGRETARSPGRLERGALALVGQTVAQHLEGRRAAELAARVEAEKRANRKLKVLLETLQRSLSLRQSEGVEAAFLEGARRLTGAASVSFEKDLSLWLDDASADEGSLAVAFEHYRPKGILCRKEQKDVFENDSVEWLQLLLGYAETVFENRRLHHQVRSSLQQLSESQAQLIRANGWVAAGRLAASAAHELNTPLGAIKLSAETALAFLKDQPKPATESLALIQRSVERCRKVTERLLVYSRPSEEKVRESFDLSTVVEDSLRSLQQLLESKKVTLDWQPSRDAQVVGDRADCFWAITNVLRNAVDALSDCNQPRKIRIRETSRAEVHTLTVEDSGPGLSAEIEDNLFEPFCSTKKLGEGNGLGLAISRRNLRAWGGDIETTESKLGGAAFRLTFPK